MRWKWSRRPSGGDEAIVSDELSVDDGSRSERETDTKAKPAGGVSAGATRSRMHKPVCNARAPVIYVRHPNLIGSRSLGKSNA